MTSAPRPAPEPPSNASPTDAAPADHWRRFRRLMLLMLGIAAVAIGAALWWLQRSGTPMPFHMVVAVSLAIGVSLLLTGALMGLVFVSARSGHDDAVRKFPADS